MTADRIDAPPPGEPPVLRSEDLLRGEREVRILHGGEAYRLRVTSNDKLILTK
jgi:hemin uptake protein HemP